MKESALKQFLNVQHTDLCQCNCKLNYVADSRFLKVRKGSNFDVFPTT